MLGDRRWSQGRKHITQAASSPRPAHMVGTEKAQLLLLVDKDRSRSRSRGWIAVLLCTQFSTRSSLSSWQVADQSMADGSRDQSPCSLWRRILSRTDAPLLCLLTHLYLSLWPFVWSPCCLWRILSWTVGSSALSSNTPVPLRVAFHVPTRCCYLWSLMASISI